MRLIAALINEYEMPKYGFSLKIDLLKIDL